MSKLIIGKEINWAYRDELLTTLNGSGVALIELSGLNHPSGGGGSKKRKGDEQEENSRVGTGEHVEVN